MKPFLLCLLSGIVLIFNSHSTRAQSILSQTIKGVVQDADSKKPIAGAAVQLLNSNRGAVSDSAGQFKIEGVAVGRQSLLITTIGYDSKVVSEVMVSSGKEIVVTVLLTENIRQLNEVIISSQRSRTKALNEFATIGARSFSVEETKRYAATAFDPARMAQNFAGVANNGDGSNEIVIRGNSPKGILWRMEGVEIPNPNHFSALGATGGAISMLSSSTLGGSDFYTGAFPAEFGNALSGVFDLNLRTGNKDKREHSVMIGGMGLEAATEGYFKKGASGSYLINYRYSTLSLMKNFLGSLNGVLPDYQDLSFKLNFPAKRLGTFSVFGLGGISNAIKDPVKDSTQWKGDEPNYVINEKGKTGVVGLSNQLFFNNHSYIKTVLAVSGTFSKGAVDTLNAPDNYSAHIVGRSRLTDGAYRISILYNNKVNARHTFRTGMMVSHLTFDFNTLHYDDVDGIWKKVLNGKGDANYYQAYAQWKYRINNRIIFNSGLHTSFFTLNNTYSIEPRGAFTYQAAHNQSFTIAAGTYAKPEHLSTYLLNNNQAAGESHYPNKELELTKAAHFILGYNKGFKEGLSLKVEAYYQYLYDVPVEKKADSYFSILNASSIDGLGNIDTLVSAGTGRNYGVDITVEKSFNKQYYFLATASLYQSRYTNYDKKEFNTFYSRNYQLNTVAGKEWKKGNRIWGLNGKVLTSGGLRQSPIDTEASKRRGKVVYVKNEYYTQMQPAYYRLDMGVSYKINKGKSTHTIMLDVQNLTNHKNLFASYYNNNDGAVKNIYQMGFFPIINYRVEF